MPNKYSAKSNGTKQILVKHFPGKRPRFSAVQNTQAPASWNESDPRFPLYSCSISSFSDHPSKSLGTLSRSQTQTALKRTTSCWSSLNLPLSFSVEKRGAMLSQNKAPYTSCSLRKHLRASAFSSSSWQALLPSSYLAWPLHFPHTAHKY